MVKINLNALKKKNEETTNQDENIQTQEVLNDTIKKEEKIEVKNVSKQEEVIQKPKVKISLKDLNIKEETKDNKENEVKNEIKLKKETQEDEIKENKTKENNTIKINIKKESESKIIEEVKVIEEQKIKEDNIDSEHDEKKEEKINIIDWDTNCSFIHDEKTEIFTNYKGSYSQENKKEDDKQNEKNVNEEQITLNKEIINKKSKKVWKITFLEKYRKWIKENQKKVLIWAACFGFIILWTSWIMINNYANKSNINEIPLNHEIKVEDKDQAINTPNNENFIDVNKNDNWDNVKEIKETNVDNSTKNGKINKNVENYLLKKYKK